MLAKSTLNIVGRDRRYVLVERIVILEKNDGEESIQINSDSGYQIQEVQQYLQKSEKASAILGYKPRI